jgi:hypothetical protein
MQSPLNLDRSTRSSGVTPDGKVVPLAWDYSSNQMMMKVAFHMPWNAGDGHKAAIKLAAAGGQYLPDLDEWFRGVWTVAPKNICDADYTRKQQKALSNGGGYPRLNAQTTAGWLGGGYSDSVGSTVGEAEDEPETPPDDGGDEGEPEDAPSGESAYSPRAEIMPSHRVIIERKKKKARR